MADNSNLEKYALFYEKIEQRPRAQSAKQKETSYEKASLKKEQLSQLGDDTQKPLQNASYSGPMQSS